MKYLVDANVLSEVTRPEPCPAVVKWLRKHERDLTVTPIVLGEIEYGIGLTASARKRKELELWFAEGMKRLRVIDLDAGEQQVPDATERWSVEQLPAGFRLIQSINMPVSVSAQADENGPDTQTRAAQIQHLIFSDGMTSVSVFVEQRVADNKLLIGVSRMGAVNAFGQSLNGHHVTVIGEVPMLTVRQIAQSIVPLQSEVAPHD